MALIRGEVKWTYSITEQTIPIGAWQQELQH